jgi:hypothetical protein
LLTVGSSPRLAPSHEPTGPHHQLPEPAAPRLWTTSQRAASLKPSAACCDRGAAFHVQKLLAQQPERGAPPTAPEMMLAAYHAHLATRIRYFGPLTPVDLRV